MSDALGPARSVLFARDYSGSLGAVSYVWPQADSSWFSSVETTVRRGDQWTSLGGGGCECPDPFSDRTLIGAAEGPWLVPYGSGSEAGDNLPAGVVCRYLTVRARPEIDTIIVNENGASRRIQPGAHGHLVIVYSSEDLPDVAGWDREGRQLFDGLDDQHGFAGWVAWRRHGNPAW